MLIETVQQGTIEVSGEITTKQRAAPFSRSTHKNSQNNQQILNNLSLGLNLTSRNRSDQLVP